MGGYTVDTWADISVRNKTYRALLALLNLSGDHEKNLLRRGLSFQMIEENLYRTVPMAGQAMLCQKLLEQGCTLAGVPGFYQAKSGHWMFVSPGRGFLIPVLDMAGCIQGLTVRLDQSHKGKYRWVSSYDYPGGVKACARTEQRGIPEAGEGIGLLSKRI